jgi:hypothetical protein
VASLQSVAPRFISWNQAAAAKGRGKFPVRAEGESESRTSVAAQPTLGSLGLRRGQADDFARRAGMRLKFVSQHKHIRRGFDPEPDLIPRNPHYGQNDRISEPDPLGFLP